MGRGKVRRGAGSEYKAFNCWALEGPRGRGGGFTPFVVGVDCASLGWLCGSCVFVVGICAISAMMEAMLSRSHIEISRFGSS